MSSITPIQTPYTGNELAKQLNDNLAALDQDKANVTDLSNYIPTTQRGTANGVAVLDASGEVAQNAKTATTATNYNVSSGGIKTKFDAQDSEITNIKNGNTTVGKAVILDPATPPGNSKYYGTSPSGTLGFHDLPEPQDGGYPGPTKEPFTAADARWGAAVDDVYTLTIPYTGTAYLFDVFKQDGAVFSKVFVDVQHDNTKIYIRAMVKFDGYIIMG